MDPFIVPTALLVLVALALAFDFMNGFHDAANSIATVVSTGVLKPYQAVAWAALFNFLAVAFFELNVAATVGKNIIEPGHVDQQVIFGALVGAIAWNLITWYYGIPSSSSHALIGGMIGSVVAKTAGTQALLAPGIAKTAVFIIVSPLLGFAWSTLLTIIISWICFRMAPSRVDRVFRRLQLVSSALYSLGHGSNDAQKTMGIIWLLLIASGAATADHLPQWVIISCYAAIGCGTLFGGWRIVKTMGQRITKIKPVGGFSAETGGAMTLFLASSFGIPVSTTHTITGSIIGVGSAQRGFSAVRWGVAGNIVLAWVLTIPASSIMAAAAWWAGHFFF